MGRSSRSQADENRARIVEVASGLFRARGIEAVGIADVMKAAGMTQGGFYRHFESKDALAAEACALAFDKAAANWQRVIDRAAQKGEDAAEALVAYYLTPRPAEMTCPMVALAADAARRPDDDRLRRSYSAGVERLTGMFIAAAATGHPSPVAAASAQARFATMVGANLLAVAASGGDDFRQAAGSVAAT
ncbi:MAG: TetR family transcriptional regulator [Sphingobium sp.]